MKFSVNRKLFVKALTQAGRMVPSRAIHPALLNVKIQAMAEGLRLTAFDLSVGIELAIAAEVEEPGEILLPSKLLADLVGKLSGDTLYIEVGGEFLTKIRCGSGAYEIQGMATAEYPELPWVDEEAIAIPLGELRSAIGATLFAVSEDETKPILTGIHWSGPNGTLELVSTDGHRLALAATGLEFDGTSTIPSRALREVLKLEGDEIEVILGGSLASFRAGGCRITTRVLEGHYPNYQQLFPREFPSEVSAGRKALLEALERVAVIADARNSTVVLAIAASSIEVVAEAQDVGSGSESVAAVCDGEPMAIAFNVKYLIESLKNLVGDAIVLRYSTETRPVVLEPVCGGVRHLVMPVQIRS